MGELGKFIVLEGQGCSGKTEQLMPLVKRLEGRGLSVIDTQEPGGVASAIAIREEILQRRAEKNITPEEEVDLFYKSRQRFLEELVKPSLKKGIWVVSTRFSPSTVVYQGYEGGVDLNYIRKKDEEVVGSFKPDLYLLLDVEPEEIMKRVLAGKRQMHGYNEADMQKIVLRRNAYLEIARQSKDKNWQIINGNLPVEQVSIKIWQAVVKTFGI